MPFSPHVKKPPPSAEESQETTAEGLGFDLRYDYAKLTFIFNGSKWHVECWGKATGNGSTGATAAFATS